MANTPVPGRPTPASLPEVVRRFWWPVYGEVRSRGHPPAAALRLCGAVLGRSAEGRSFLRSDDRDGRLRLVLRSELTEVLSKADRNHPVLPLDGISLPAAEARDDYEQFPEQTAFNRRWAVVVLEQALTAVQAGYQAEGRAGRFTELRPLLERNSPGEADAGEVEELRRCLRDAVRRQVADTVTTPLCLEAELVELFGES